MDNTYKLDYKENSCHKFFKENAIKDWCFEAFEASYNQNLSKPANSSKLKNIYLHNLKNIQDSKDVPEYVKNEASRLSTLSQTQDSKPGNISYNIRANNSFLNTSGSICINSTEQPQPSPKQTYR